MANSTLFLIIVLIWGTTWIAITFQLGEVDPLVSVGVRFALAATVLFAYCKIKRLSLSLPSHIHFKMAIAGICLYTLDYTMLYQSQMYIISAVVAVMSSCMVYFNVVLRRILLKKPIRSEVMIGATFGMVGIALIFWPEFAKVKTDHLLLVGIGFAMVSFLSASFGNVISERILDHGTPVIQMNFWAMSYGVLFISLVALIKGVEFSLPREPQYFAVSIAIWLGYRLWCLHETSPADGL